MIFYFTGTGNCLYAAKTLGEELGEEIHNIPDYLNNNDGRITVGEEEVIGLVFPVYYYSLPTVVEEFLDKIEIAMEKKSRCFILATCGSTTGDSTKIAHDILAKKDVKTDFVFALEMPDNYILMYDVQDKEKQDRIIENSKLSLEEIVRTIKDDKKGDYNEIKGPMPGMMTMLAGAIYKKGRKTDKFYVTENCTSCNLCEEICPAGVIKIKNGRPVWEKEQCVHCLACIHRCPVQAIQYGKRTEQRGRYVNPLSGF